MAALARILTFEKSQGAAAPIPRLIAYAYTGGGGGGHSPHDWLRTRVQKALK